MAHGAWGVFVCRVMRKLDSVRTLIDSFVACIPVFLNIAGACAAQGVCGTHAMRNLGFTCMAKHGSLSIPAAPPPAGLIFTVMFGACRGIRLPSFRGA